MSKAFFIEEYKIYRRDKFNSFVSMLICGLIVGVLYFGVSFANIILGMVSSNVTIQAPGEIARYALLAVFGLYCLTVFLKMIFWRISVNGTEIEKRNFLGIKKTFDFNDIDKAIIRKHSIAVYSNGKKLLKIDDNCSKDYFTFVEQVKTLPIEIINK